MSLVILIEWELNCLFISCSFQYPYPSYSSYNLPVACLDLFLDTRFVDAAFSSVK